MHTAHYNYNYAIPIPVLLQNILKVDPIAPFSSVVSYTACDPV